VTLEGNTWLPRAVLETTAYLKANPLEYAWFRHCEACIFVYDVTSRQSFEAIQCYFQNFTLHRSLEMSSCSCNRFPLCPPRPHFQGMVFVLANKIDIARSDWEIGYEEGEEFYTSIGAVFLPVSAKTGAGVGNDLLPGIARQILLQRAIQS